MKEAGYARWDAIACALNERIPAEKDRLTYHSLRKIAYGERDNPGLKDVQLLIDYFQSIERGERELPEPSDEKARA